MEVLWSPWRSKYIETFKNEDLKKKEDECFLCQAGSSAGMDKELLVVARRELCFAILNKYPYNNGHVLIAPYRHAGELDDLSDEELAGMMKLVRECTGVMKEVYDPHGFNIGINIGRVAGAGVPGHIHIHVVPRWNGDTSFMATLADIKVVSQSLADTQEIFSEKLKKL